MMLVPNYLPPVKVFSQRIRIPEEYTGGYRDVPSTKDLVSALRERALAIIERRMERYSSANNIELIEPIYLDGIEVFNGHACIRQMVVCRMKCKLVVVK